MKTHFEQLLAIEPKIISGKILDLGSGRGDFLIEVTQKKADARGLEYNPIYIEESRRKAKERGVAVEVVQGVAENMPFENCFFDFINICEVIEHVEEPEKLLAEVRRLLKPGGLAYLSVPNRFGFYDQHFHLILIGWLPRRWANFLIGVLGQHKDYSGVNGRQKITEMHYFTFGQISRLVKKFGFQIYDIRQVKINKKFGRLNLIIFFPYFFLRSFYLDSFHLLLTKIDKDE